MPLINLKYAAALYGTEGYLLSELDPKKRYKIIRWPNFGQVPYRSIDTRIAAELSRCGGSLSELNKSTGIPSKLIASFLNACHVAGILTEQATTDNIQIKHAPKRDLAELIRSRLQTVKTNSAHQR